MNIDLRGYLQILGRWRWALVLGLAFGLGLGYLALSYLGMLPAYTATVTVLPSAVSSTTQASQYDTLVLTFAELARQDTVTQAVINTLALPLTPQEVADATKVRVIPGTALLEISVTRQDPQAAAAMANEVARQLANQASVRTYRLQVVSPAVAPKWPDPAAYVNVVLAGVLGLLLAAGVVFWGEYMRDAVRGTAATASRLELPVLGTLARGKRGAEQAIWPLVEQIIKLNEAAGHRRVLITSPGPGEGKSTVAVLLASAWGRTGRTAVLVDAHIKHPVLHERLHGSNDVGLADWLAPQGKEVPLQTLSKQLALLPSGPAPSDPAAVLVSQRWPEVLAALDRQADLVIIDGPPVLPAAEIALLAPQVDGILLVLRAGRTKFPAAGEALEALKLVDGPVLGLVLNQG